MTVKLIRTASAGLGVLIGVGAMVAGFLAYFVETSRGGIYYDGLGRRLHI